MKPTLYHRFGYVKYNMPVSIKISCGDDYAAQVVFDDIIDRLRRGEGLTLRLTQPEPLPENQEGEK